MLSSTLLNIAEKVQAGERLSFEEGVALFETDQVAWLGHLADSVRRRRHGRTTFYNVNRHLNPTNVCYWDCTFCSFYRKAGDPEGYTYTVDQAVAEIRPSYEAGITEIHIVGGLHPTLPFEYYLDLLRGLKTAFPKIHLKAFTMVELDHFKRITRLSEDEVIDRLVAAGLDSCPGGGAEIFAETVRKQICKHKCGTNRWLDFSKRVHLKGLRSNATMLYGHIESLADRVDHMIRLRNLQDETKGFQCFIPLAFYPKDTELAHLPGPTAIDSLKTIAVSRLMLDNFDHIKAYWVMLGRQTAQLALHFGANDLDGTVSGGGPLVATYSLDGAAQCKSTRDDIVQLVLDAGLEPVERDTLYQPIHPVQRETEVVCA
ncbi:MAG: aminofutalosine synthase MqnE [Blastocatellia bacterium]|nr:aminofutalosine synthase MqnE [Blastocatellia bacterium]HMZ81930.1 aminofutalosine synthase MqnE [Acidobacteriota bacterium]